MQMFRDRRDAGTRLARVLEPYAGRRDAIVLALPRGGVPVGYEVATRLGIALDVLVVRKLGVPDEPELAMGAVASGGLEVLNDRVVTMFGLTDEEIAEVTARERMEVVRRELAFRGDRPVVDLHDMLVLLVDDGLATGSSMLAAVDAVRQRDPAAVIVAVPGGPPEACELVAEHADRIICLARPTRMYAVGMLYDDFAQTRDSEVRELLEAAARERERRLAVETISLPS